MANVTVPTSPPGVWPAETTTVTDLQYAAVEADVLRRKPGVLVESVDERDRLDAIEKATHRAPRITTALADTTVADNDTNVAFEVDYTGDPAVEVHWYITRDGGLRTELHDSDSGLSITTSSTTSTLSIDSIDIATDDQAVIEAVVRNYKGELSSTATLTVEPEPAISTVTPNTGGTAGGTAVVIAGTNLDAATGVTFGGTAGTAFSVVAGAVHVTTPAKSAGAYDVVVQHPLGNATKTNGFTYA